MSLRRHLSLVTVLALAAGLLIAPAARAGTSTIAVDVGAPIGVVQPSVTGQMMEWASDEMNGAWAERVRDRSFETATIGNPTSSTGYDLFSGTALDRSRWTPVSLDTSAAGTVAVSGGTAAITQSTPGRFGLLSNPLPDTRFATVSVETRVISYTGTNAILNLYGGAGAGDFSHFVELAIEGGVVKVFADGRVPWTGGAVSMPADLRIDAGPLSPNGSRDLTFYVNGNSVYTLTGFTLLPADFRAMLYGWGGTVSYDRIGVTPDGTYDSFSGTTLSSRFSPVRLEGATDGSVAVGSGMATVTGGANSRYGILSAPIRNTSVDWTTITARLSSASGINGLINIYGGSGAGDFSKFVEFGVEGGVAKVFTAGGAGNWTGSAVTLPATLAVKVSPWWSNGRQFRFYVNGSPVYTLQTVTDVREPDYRVFLYGYGTSVTRWDYLTVQQTHVYDRWDSGFEGDGGLNGSLAASTLAGGWGSMSQGNSQLTINGAASSRYGAMSAPLPESDIYRYTVEARLDSVSGTNGLLNIYGGTGRGDFTRYVEFGVEAGLLRVFGDGVSPWTGPAVSLPVVLRIEVGGWTPAGRTIAFYANGRLVHALDGVTAVPNTEYHAYVYGWGTSVTKWDYLTWWRSDQWRTDGFGAVATSDQNAAGSNGRYAQQLSVSSLSASGRSGISQNGIELVAGHQYQVSMYLKQSGMTSPVSVVLGPDSPDGPVYPAWATGGFAGVSGSWTKYTATLTPTSGSPQAKLLIAATGTGTLWIDQVSVMPLNPAEVTLGGWRTDFVNALTALAPQSIRWPGGIIADSYNWTDGVGPRDQRPPMYYGQWEAEWMTNDVGTDEILALGAALDIPVVLNVNWGGGTGPTAAANWVQYTNGSTGTSYGAQRAANGHAAPWNVRTWEIGNEVWGSWTAGWTTAANFAASYNVFHDAMAAQDPTLRYIGEGGDGTKADETWNQTVLSTSGSRLDHLSIHYYSPQGLPQNYSDAGVYAASVGAPVTIGNRLAATRNSILAAGTRDIKVAVTEHNAMYFGEEHRRTRTLEAAIQEAGLLNLFRRNSDVNELNAASTLMNFWDGSVIRTGVRGILLTPGYLVQQQASQLHGPLLLPTTVSTGTFAAPAVGNLPAATVPVLDVTTTRALDGTHTYLSVINRSATTAETTTINLTGAGAVGAVAAVSTVNSASASDQNTWSNPTLVSTSTGTTAAGASFGYSFPAHSVTVITLTTNAAALAAGPWIIGRVTTVGGSPIAGAAVSVIGGGSGTTDAAGYYRIAAVPGRYDLTVTASGHPSDTRTAVEVSDTGANPLPVRLS